MSKYAAINRSLDETAPVPYQRAQVRKLNLVWGWSTFSISIYRVLILNRPLFAKDVMVQIKDVVLAFSLNPVCFPSLPVVEIRRVE